MWSTITRVLGFVAGYKNLLWVVPAVLGIGAAVTWFVTYYEPKGRSEYLEEQLAQRSRELIAAGERHGETLDLYRRQLRANRELHRHFDNIRERLREIDDEQTRKWRAERVPGPVADGLRQLTPTDDQ